MRKFKSMRTPNNSQFGKTKLSTSYKSKVMHFLVDTKGMQDFQKWSVWAVAPKLHM